MTNNQLNNNQQKAVNHIEGPLLVLAGAGSGKTKVVTTKIAKLIQMGVPAQDILAITFTNKAAKEMLNRINKMTASRVLACTFHSLGAKILREAIHNIGYSNDFTIYDEDDSLKLIKECLKTLNIKEDKGLLKKIKSKISTAKNDLIDLNNIHSYSNFSKTDLDIFNLYQTKLKSFNALDFDDLLYLPVQLFNEKIDILQKYQKRWSFLLIDEYQDTNYAQYTLAKMLSAQHQNICVVGDPDQSIYSWRGAQYQNILNFDKDFKNAQIINLEENYRSTSNILDAANTLIKNNTNRLEKNLKTSLGKGDKVKVFIAENDKLEANFVAEQILKHRFKEKLDFNDIAIFYRTNSQSRIFEDILLSHKIPYIIYGGLSFYQRKEIKDIIAFLRLMISNSDFISFARTINLPKRGFGKVALAKIFYTSEKENIEVLKLLSLVLETPSRFNDLKLSKKQLVNLQEYISNIYELRKLKDSLNIDELISEVLTLMKYSDYLKEDPETIEDRKENIDELITKACDWQENNDGHLKEFLESITLLTSTDVKEDTSQIKLMTLHNSKGLEFECVFMVGMEEDLFPHVNSKDSFQDLEEERRLCYVGMTRAKKNLYMTTATYRYLFGNIKITMKSRFLKELPDENTEFLSNDIAYSENIPIIENPSTSFYEGCRVIHKTFGLGMVQKIYTTSLGETVDVLFEDSSNIRSLVVKYAKLNIL